MKLPYGRPGRDAGVRSYEIVGDAIILEFADGRFRYVYDSHVPGRRHVETMKRLARRGKGLSTYVNQHVRENYAARVAIR